MSLATDLTAREAEVIKTLKLLFELKEKFVVIGGYAVNAITSHRFSVDCDLVLTGKNAATVRSVLTKNGYRVTRKNARMEIYNKSVGKRRVAVDLFLNGLVCRQTGGSWTYDLIKENALDSDVIGLTDLTRAFVPKRELLTAMKVHSGRDAYLRDLVMLSEHADWKMVAEFARTGSERKVIHQVEGSKQTISTRKFESTLKAEFSLSTDVTSLIHNAIEGLGALKANFEMSD